MADPGAVHQELDPLFKKKTGPKHYRYIINSKPVLHYKVNCALTMCCKYLIVYSNMLELFYQFDKLSNQNVCFIMKYTVRLLYYTVIYYIRYSYILFLYNIVILVRESFILLDLALFLQGSSLCPKLGKACNRSLEELFLWLPLRYDAMRSSYLELTGIPSFFVMFTFGVR